MWQVVAASVVAVLGLGAFIWYKFRQGAQAQADSEMKDAQITRDEETRQALEQQIAAKSLQEQKELKDEITKVFSIDNQDAKQRAALDILAKLRGTR